MKHRLKKSHSRREVFFMANISSNGMYGVSLQLKYKNSSEWSGSDVLLAGEIGFELD